MEATSLKKINLEELQKPKTLILIYYKNKRISIPLFEAQPNITEYLYHQIEKFELTVLQPQQEALSIKVKSKANNNNIVCFCSREQDKNRTDLKMNILLSMMRLPFDVGKSRADLRNLDITLYYKYIEIEPYYMPTQKQLIPEYQLHTVLESDKVYTVYLGRRIQDGRFFAIQVGLSSNKTAERQYQVLKQIQEEQHHQEVKDLGAIPQIEELRNSDGLIIFVLEYCGGGSLVDLPKKASEMQCLEYMKQLIWGVHTLHQRYNLLHRHVTLDSIYLDFRGNLRILNYRHCQPCFSSNYLISSEIPRSYEEDYELEDGTTPPEVKRSARYNKLVDYYGVGAVLYQIYHGRKPNNEIRNEKIKEREGIQIAIENLMSENVSDREAFTNEIIGELHQEKKQMFSLRSEIPENDEYIIPPNKIKIGHNFIMEDRAQNTILHEDVVKSLKPSNDDQMYYLNPVGKKSKSKKKKSKSKEKKSQDNSGVFKKSFDTKSKKSNKSKNSKKSKNSQQKSMDLSLDRSKKGLTKSISQNKKVQSKVVKVERVGSPKKMIPPRSHGIRSPEKMGRRKEEKTQEFYFHKITHKHK